MKCKIANNLNSSEALYAFVGWLTSRDTTIIAGSKYDAAVWAEAVEDFTISQMLPRVRDDFSKRIKPYPD